MREKRGVLLTILISTLLLGACGNQESVPASVAELETVPIKQPEDSGQNGMLPEEENGSAGTTSEESGENGTSDGASGSSG
ncbi:MAG TPA: hypothetical protein DCZ91_14865, partial [Lachnospiraceae bacterium]|nr:hypothetical protein [Lachnospiraceae bacterium]